MLADGHAPRTVCLLRPPRNAKCLGVCVCPNEAFPVPSACVPQLLLSACQQGAGLDAQLAVVQCVAVDGLPFDDPGIVYTEADWKRYHHGGFSDDEDDLFTLGARSSAPFALSLFSSLALLQRERMLVLFWRSGKRCFGAATGRRAETTRCAHMCIASRNG